MISQCAGCGKFIQGTSSDAVITGKALCWKNYHYACAKHEWNRLSRTGKSRVPRDRLCVDNGLVSLTIDPAVKRQETELARPAKKTQFHVQCVLITHGKEESRWHGIFDTLDEAEGYCEKQMAVSDFDKDWEAASAEKDVSGKPVCNASPLKYVNCTISMMMTNGKSTVIDERIHPVALMEIMDEENVLSESASL